MDPDRAWTADTPWAGDACVVCGDQVAVPAQHVLGTDQWPALAQHGVGESVRQLGEQGPVRGVNRILWPCSWR
jgi:hypothetical protein